jgi:hypothetical protein
VIRVTARRDESVSTYLALADKASSGDRLAALELVELLHPTSVTELVGLVAPDGLIRTVAFDALADAFNMSTKESK